MKNWNSLQAYLKFKFEILRLGIAILFLDLTLPPQRENIS
jgi:hypothetical protein